MKKRIFLLCLFYCFFLRLQIYEAIAAIFWQYASYVCILIHKFGAIVFFLKNCILKKKLNRNVSSQTGKHYSWSFYMIFPKLERKEMGHKFKILIITLLL